MQILYIIYYKQCRKYSGGENVLKVCYISFILIYINTQKSNWSLLTIITSNGHITLAVAFLIWIPSAEI